MFKTSFFKNASILFSGSVISQLVSFAIIPILTRFYSPEEFGDLTLFTTIIMVVGAFLTMRYSLAIVLESDSTKAMNLVVLSFIINLSICIVLFLIIVLFKKQISDLFNINTNALWLYLIPPVCFVSGLIETITYWLNGKQQYKKISTNRMITSSLSGIYKLGHPFIKLFSGNGMIIGHTFGLLAGLFHALTSLISVSYRIRREDIQMSEIKGVARKYKNFAFYSTPAGLLNMLGNHIPVFLISVLIGSEMNGYFGNAYKLAYLPLGIVSYSIGQVFYERLSKLKERTAVSISFSFDIFKKMFSFALFPIAMLTVFGDLIVTHILGEKWQMTGTFVQILLPFYFALYLNSPFAAAFEVFGKQKSEMFFSLLFLVTNTASLLIGYFVFNGIVSAIMFFAISGFISRFFMTRYLFKLIGRNITLDYLKGSVIFGITIGILWLIKYLLF
jgi:O-antigen/teichoic acid export membrane protein